MYALEMQRRWPLDNSRDVSECRQYHSDDLTALTIEHGPLRGRRYCHAVSAEQLSEQRQDPVQA